VNIPVIPPPIKRAARVKPTIAHVGNERLPVGGVAAAGAGFRCFGFVGAVVVAAVVGAVVVSRVCVDVSRGFGFFGSCFFGFVVAAGGGGGGAGAVAMTVVVSSVEVTSVVVGAAVVVALVVVPAASACEPAANPATAIAAPRQP
jgi:hypothetical protein